MIFISYRRSEDAAFAGRLFDRLERTFRREALFMDVDSIAPGQDFVSILKARVAECDVLLALIGRGWLTATDEAGRLRLNNAEDFVRIEIEAALTQRKRYSLWLRALMQQCQVSLPEIWNCSRSYAGVWVTL